MTHATVFAALLLVGFTQANCARGSGRKTPVVSSDTAILLAALPESGDRNLIRQEAGRLPRWRGQDPNDTLEKWLSDKLGAKPETVTALQRANEQPTSHQLPESTDELLTISRSTLKSYFTGGVGPADFEAAKVGWERFQMDFAASGYHTLSRPGVAGDEALVLHDWSCGVVCGEQTFVLLKRVEGQWTVAGRAQYSVN